MTRVGEPLVTLVTPSYNRADLLPRLKDSLDRQTSGLFQWLVVDDGSTDGTPDLLARWASEGAHYRIEYVSQPNGGKHRALNTALAIIDTPWLMVIDSDDWLIDGAIELIGEWVSGVGLNASLAGVGGLRLYPNGDPIGGQPQIAAGEFLECTNLERGRHGLLGDKAEIYRTEVARAFPYPEFEGERFLEEAIVGDAMAEQGYRLRWYPQGVYYCDYQPDGLSARIDVHHENSFEGYTAYARQYVRLRQGADRLALIGVYVDVAARRGLSARQASRRIEVPALIGGLMGMVRRSLRTFRARGRR